MRNESLAWRISRAIILGVLLLLVIVPVFWGFALAFRSNQEIVKISGLSVWTFLPKAPTLDNFRRFFGVVNIARVFPLTVFVCACVTILSLLLNSLAAYAFARMNFPGRNALFAVVVATMILPIEILIVPLYRTVKNLGLMDTIPALILPFIASGFGIFFMRQFMTGIPKEFDEAALMDGGGRVTIFFRILLPLSRTPLVTLGFIIFLQQWDSFLVPVTFISSENNMVLQVAINNIYAHLFYNDNALLFAGIVVAAVPIMILFAFLQKYYVSGITSSGIKG